MKHFLKKYLLGTLLFLGFTTHGFCSSILALDEVLDKGFNSSQLRSVNIIEASKSELSREDLNDLVNSSTLNNLHTLSLRNQEAFEDFHLEALSQNPTFSRLFNLDLRGTSITSLQPVLNSDITGSVRHLPQISGRYGIPSSEIYVKVDEDLEEYIEDNPRFNFNIQYKNPYGTQTAPNVSNSIKWIVAH
jgi:hypothetical protein